jgi:uncharacterized protein (DUF924 family)
VNNDEALEVLGFWFGAPPLSRRAEWFRKDAAFDAQIRERFGLLADAALRGTIDVWHTEPLSALARLIVLDQFPRNLHRGSASAFAGDAQALVAAQDIVARGWDRGYAPVQRWFAYLPFEHAEDIAMQRQSLRLFAALAQDAPDEADTVEWAQKHHDVIQRFGRFPHRNAALGRPSTAEEIEFLMQPGSGF